ncbi:MAG: hypothetical protein Q9216_002151 [Gyalolechia sp. 2 TL-2023]
MLSSFRYISLLVIPMVVWVGQGRNIPRDDPAGFWTTDGVVYAPYHATCADDPSIKNPFGMTSPITVKNDCDTAMSRVCGYAVANFQKNEAVNDIRAAYGDGPNKCEATLLFPAPRLAEPITYDVCIGVFQSITVGCMLVQPGSVGTPGQQAGLVHVEYTANGGAWNTTYPRMKASNFGNYNPGYMVGPPKYFGNYSYGIDISNTYV